MNYYILYKILPSSSCVVIVSEKLLFENTFVIILFICNLNTVVTNAVVFDLTGHMFDFRPFLLVMHYHKEYINMPSY